MESSVIKVICLSIKYQNPWLGYDFLSRTKQDDEGIRCLLHPCKASSRISEIQLPPHQAVLLPCHSSLDALALMDAQGQKTNTRHNYLFLHLL